MSSSGPPGHCDNGNDFDGRIGLRVSSIFVILIGSFLGQWSAVVKIWPCKNTYNEEYD